jgi:hypothetical protein
VNPLYTLVARRAGRLCEYCRAPERVSGSVFEVEHVVPQSAGGSDDPTNLALACPSCNRCKGERQAARDPASGRTVPLFNPRTDRWDDHFRIDIDRAEVVGLTPIGRATVACLDMNSPQQFAARALWIQLGLYP